MSTKTNGPQLAVGFSGHSICRFVPYKSPNEYIMEVGGIEPPSEEDVKPPTTRVADLFSLASGPADRQALDPKPACVFKPNRQTQFGRAFVSVALSGRGRPCFRQDGPQLAVKLGGHGVVIFASCVVAG